MADEPDIISHPVFGELRWEPQYSWWFTQIRLPSGEWLDVIVDPGEEDRLNFIATASDRYVRVMQAERQLLRTAIREDILSLYNDTWRLQDEPELSAAEMLDRLELTFVRIDTVIPITLSYHADDLFGGHCADVKVDEDLEFRRVALVG